MKENKLSLLAVFVTSVFYLCFISNLYAQEIPLQFSQQSIEIKGAVDDVILKDLNNDGREEILFQQGRNLIIYVLQPSSTGTSFIQNSVYRLPDDVCIYDIAKTGSQQQNLIYISAKGVSSLPIRLETSGEKRQSITPTLFFPTSTIFRNEVFDVPLHKEFLLNLENNNRLIVIPDSNKFRLVSKGNNDTYRAEEIRLPMASYVYCNNSSIFEPLVTEVSLPSFVFVDLNNDKRNDFIVPKQNKIYGYLLKESDGGKQEFKDIGCLLDAPESDSQLVKDINNDGCADVVCRDFGEGIIYVHLNRYRSLPQGGTEPSNQSRYLSGFSNTPTQIIRTNSWIFGCDLIDLNDDSLDDLVLVQMNKLGIMGGLQAVLAQTLEWEIVVYLARPTKDTLTPLYPKSPDYIRTIRLPFSLSYAGSLFATSVSLNLNVPYVWCLKGDFNGDKVKDLLISGAKEGSLEIYLGDKDKIFNSSPSTFLNLVSVNQKFKLKGGYYISDINNDGKSDVIIPLIREDADKSICHCYEILLSR